MTRRCACRTRRFTSAFTCRPAGSCGLTSRSPSARAGRAGRPGHVRPSRAAPSGTMVNVSERPAEAADRAVPGFWEGDLIIGQGNKSQVATLVERTTRLVLLVKIPYDRHADRVARLLAGKMESLPDFMKKSVTWDQGKEMARHADFTVRTG